MPKIRVLIVEDASFMRDMVRKGIRSAYPAFQADEAIHGKQALEMLQKQRYDLVLCDWEMPEMNGAELLAWLRGNETTRDTPFVMVTSRGDRENVMQAIELKANNYIVKPFSNDKLTGVVTTVLTKSLGISADELKRQGGRLESAREVGMSGAVPVAAHISGEESRPSHTAQPSASPRKVRPREKVLLPLRFSDAAVTLLLREMDNRQVEGVIRRADKIPAILDLVALDIESEGEVARLNGYVHTLQAREDGRESEFINITLQLVDQDDPEKMAQLERFLRLLG